MTPIVFLGISLLNLAQPVQGEPRSIVLGWHDEFDSRRSWAHLAVENKAKAAQLAKGTIHLWLEHVPSNWPYEFQWSGVTRQVRNDIGGFPILMTRVTELQGYTHLDIDALDNEGQTLKTFRSPTLTSPGVSSLDLSRELPPKLTKLRIRMIVGGSNAGCSVTYDWLRFVNPKDEQFLLKNPEYVPQPVSKVDTHREWF